jgi:hypothetical protein
VAAGGVGVVAHVLTSARQVRHCMSGSRVQMAAMQCSEGWDMTGAGRGPVMHSSN